MRGALSYFPEPVAARRGLAEMRSGRRNRVVPCADDSQLRPDRVHAETGPLFDVQKNRAILINGFSDTLRSSDRLLNFS